MRPFLFLIAPALAIAGGFTTSLGDTYPFVVSAITTDPGGNTYVVGSRQLAAGAVAPVSSSTSLAAGSDVFLTKLDPNGKVLFTDTFAGKSSDIGIAITLDPSGNIYIAGITTSPDFPLSKALQTQINPGGLPTGFIMKLSSDGTTILYSTFFGGTLGQSSISALATDAKGNLYVTGSTNASDFPQTSGLPSVKLSTGPLGTQGAIVAEISAGGDKIIYSGVLAGNSPDCGLADCFQLAAKSTSGTGIGVDAAGNVYVGGNTNTIDLPTTAGVLLPHGVGAFVAKVNAGGTALSYVTYLGSGENFLGGEQILNTLIAIAVDPAGNAYLAGSSGGFPTTPGSLQPVLAGFVPLGSSVINGFVAKLNPTGSAMVWATYLGSVVTTAQSIAIDVDGNVWATGTADSPFPNNNGWIQGPEFLVGLNSTGSALTYSALYPAATVAQSVAVDPAGLVHVAGLDAIVSVIAPSSSPTMEVFALQNAFGGNATARISPAEVVSIFGPGIGPAAAVTATPVNGVYPTTVAGVEVTVNNVNIPLLYVSANQINAVLPMELEPGAAAVVRVINGTAVSPDYAVWIAASAPQAFPAVLNQDGTINSVDNPAKSGSIVTFYATGWQSNFSPLVDGQVATTAQDLCGPGICQASEPGSDLTAAVLYGGTAPGIVAGVTQFNVQIVMPGASASVFDASLTLTSPAVTQSVYVTR